MKIHWFQHVPFEGLGAIRSWIEERGHEEECVRLFAGDPLPEADDFEFLVIMGGPMSVNDEEGYPWLVEEKKLVRQLVEAGKPVFGVCLGAQMIASSLGASIYGGPELEIGWFPVRAAPESTDASFSFQEEATVLHWHGETFDLPEGAIRLASSPVCPNQAYLLRERVIGTQFHYEGSPDAVEGFLENSYEGLSSSDTYVQTPEEIREGARKFSEANQVQLFRMLDFLVRP